MQINKPLVALAGAAVVGLGAMAAVPGVASAATAPTAVTTHPVHGAWPRQVGGAPAHLAAGSAEGYYLWHTAQGWEVRVTHPGTTHVVFAGTIRTDGTLSYRRVDDEPHDVVKLGAGRHSIGFAFNNYGRLDGLHFVTGRATEVTFNLTVDGRKAPVAKVDIGARGLHPDRVPFTVTRTAIH